MRMFSFSDSTNSLHLMVERSTTWARAEPLTTIAATKSAARRRIGFSLLVARERAGERDDRNSPSSGQSRLTQVEPPRGGRKPAGATLIPDNPGVTAAGERD